MSGCKRRADRAQHERENRIGSGCSDGPIQPKCGSLVEPEREQPLHARRQRRRSAASRQDGKGYEMADFRLKFANPNAGAVGSRMAVVLKEVFQVQVSSFSAKFLSSKESLSS